MRKKVRMMDEEKGKIIKFPTKLTEPVINDVEEKELPPPETLLAEAMNCIFMAMTMMGNK